MRDFRRADDECAQQEDKGFSIQISRSPAWPRGHPVAFGVALVLTAITTIQLGHALAIGLIASVGAPAAAMLRNGFAAALLIPAARPPTRHLERALWGIVWWFGLVLALQGIASYVSITHLPLGVALSVAFIGPLAVATTMAGRRRDLVWIIAAAAGLVLVLNPFNGPSPSAVGLAAAACAAASWAAYIVLSARLGGMLPGVQGIALAIASSTPFLLAVTIAAGGAARITPESALVAIAAGLLTVAIPFSMETTALKILPIGTFGILSSAEPAIAGIVGAVLLGQALDFTTILGIALIVVAGAGAAHGAQSVIGSRGHNDAESPWLFT